jgi:crossover junction endodeoxyribonuclease RusA
MTPILTVTLPWPSSALSPNSRDRWARIKAITPARELARLEAINTINLAPGSWCWAQTGTFSITRTFYPPNNRWFDMDNLIGCLKAYQDGIFDALGANDHLIREGHEYWGEVISGGRVVIEVGHHD